MLRMGSRWLWFAGALVPYAAVGLVQQPKAAFSTAVLPLFKAHCVSCHSGKGAAANLDLSTPEGLQKGGTSGKAFIAGQPDKSLLLDRVLGKGGLPKMPMGFAPLSATDVEKIRSWIADGAKFDSSGSGKHWAYLSPIRPKLPKVKNPAWIENPIDAFILAKLDQEVLQPSKPAPRETLLRRVYLDIVGLPPSPKDIDAFLADKTPNAYEKVVDRLLANPHYGERMARPWLDLARYADSDGFEKDLNRDAWLYRDWVINAFNANMPYDQFTIEQLAGDLIPNATVAQKVATGFNRNTMFNREGGVDQEEAYFNVILDRVGTTGTVWLGSTIQCARCHDHKYDPFSQKDFYKLYAYFGNGVVNPQGPKDVGEEKWFEPYLSVPSPDQEKKQKAWTAELAQAKLELRAKSKSLDSDFATWKEKSKNQVWTTLIPQAVKVSSGEKATIAPDGTIQLFTKTPNLSYELSFDLPAGTYRGVRIETVPDPKLSNGGAGNADGGNFVLSSVSASQGGHPKPFGVANADFVQQEFTAAGVLDSDINTGWAVYPLSGKPHELGLGWKTPVIQDAPSKLDVKLDFISSKWPQHTMAKYRVAISKAENPEQFIFPADVEAALYATSRSPEEEKRIRNYYEQISPVLRESRDKVAALQKKLNDLNSQIPTALVLQDKPISGPLFAAMHTRGEFLNKGEKVRAGTPAVFGALPANSLSNRLGLAKWIADEKNPLTARVAVNRFWEQCFGRGIVETSEDFGTQGARPTHPELLDWLATEFMDSGWDIKHIMKLIVTSNAYRQDSSASAKLLAKDSVNALVARGPRFRVEAEMIRDVMLSSAGLLSSKLGGPSVYPSQPDGVWNTPYSGEAWMTSKGADKYRRGLYTFAKRTSPYPSFLAFDATSRESCTVRRIRTNTPLQALALLNDEVVMDASKALAERMVKEGGSSDASRLKFGFRLCTGRMPSPSELGLLQGLLAKLSAKYRAMPDAAKKLADSPEQAALVMVANTLLNLDETITKE
jgi:hypothetical protein